MPSIAILGASSNRKKFGNKAVRAFREHGYTVYPVNPNESTIEGLPAISSISQVPVRPHLISSYLPPQILLPLLPEIAAKGCDELWLNPGADSPEVIRQAERLHLPVRQGCSIVNNLGIEPPD